MPLQSRIALVVDDEAPIRSLMSEILSGLGYTVETIGSGAEALERLKVRNRYGLLFTDVMMPGIDGIELLRRARSLAPEVVPIVMSGYATLETARAAVKAGAYDYVLKPFNVSEIRLAVENAVDRHRLLQENARLREINNLFAISQSFSGIHDEDTLLDYLLRAALEQLQATRGSVLKIETRSDSLTVVASAGLPEEYHGITQPVPDTISRWVAQHRKAICVSDFADAPDLAERRLGLDSGSFVSIPLERKRFPGAAHAGAEDHGADVVAILNVSEKRCGSAFTDNDLTVLNLIANQASRALENVRLLNDVQRAHVDTMKTMALALEAKDPYTHGHSTRVRDYAVEAARQLGMPAHDIETIRLGAMLHDVGKFGVSDAILNKTEALTPEEWEHIKRHPLIGFEVLSGVAFLTPDHLALVRSHHERLDGSGYPDALRGDAIDARVRVLSVADTYDAMSGDRAYREGLSRESICAELNRCAGVTLDPEVCALFVEMIESGSIDAKARDSSGLVA